MKPRASRPRPARQRGSSEIEGSWARWAKAVGRRLSEVYQSIDPDVGRHLIQLPLLSYSLLPSKGQSIRAGRPDGHAPIVFVHGLGGGRGDFLPMSTYLWIEGRRRSYRINFKRGATIREMARLLTAFVRRVAQATGMKKVDLVAHSLGGLVSRVAMAEYGLSTSVQTLVTLGSPHHGTHAARFGNTATVRDLRPDSDLFTRLRRKPWPKSVRGVSFWSRSDLMIVPAESAIVRGMEAVEMTPFTHYSYLIDPKSWSAVYAALSTTRSTSTSGRAASSRPERPRRRTNRRGGVREG